MKVILSKQCESLTGSLGRGFGYCIESRRTKNGVLYHYAKRNSKGFVPHDGHWRFIVACTEIAKSKLHITDIKISAGELKKALEEAGRVWGPDLEVMKDKEPLNARQVLEFKFRWNP